MEDFQQLSWVMRVGSWRIDWPYHWLFFQQYHFTKNIQKSEWNWCIWPRLAALSPDLRVLLRPKRPPSGQNYEVRACLRTRELNRSQRKSGWKLVKILRLRNNWNVSTHSYFIFCKLISRTWVYNLWAFGIHLWLSWSLSFDTRFSKFRSAYF